MQLQPGQTILNNKYRIERLLGRGAFGEVYLATHVLEKAPVAIKVLRSNAPGIGNTQIELYRNRFVQEARLGKGLNHPSVVRVHDWVEEKGVLYLVMEACTGGSLAERLAHASGQPMPIAEVVQIALEVAQGLAALHVQEVVHRDLKPSNILFDAQGHAKVADLGLAQTSDNLSQRTLLGSQARPQPGTPDYMSPEQATNEPHLAPPSDIYSLGMVLFEMLTGRPYSNQPPRTPVKSLRADAPARLDKLVARMLSLAPTARPWNGAAAAEELEKEQQQIAADERTAAAERPMPEQPAAGVAAQALAKDPTPPIAVPLEKEQQQIAADERTAAAERPTPEQPTAGDAAQALVKDQTPPIVVPSPPADPPPPPPPPERGLRGWALIGIGAAAVALLALGVAAVIRGGPTAAATTVARKTAAAPATVLTAKPTMTTTLPALVTAMKDTATPTPTETVTPTPTVAAGATRVREIDGAVMVFVPAGEFAMGSASDDSQAYDWEVPQQQVSVAGFWIDRTEVTNGQYRKFMEAGGYDNQEYWTEAGWAMCRLVAGAIADSIRPSSRWCACAGTRRVRMRTGLAVASQLRRSGKRRRGGRMAVSIRGGTRRQIAGG